MFTHGGVEPFLKWVTMMFVSAYHGRSSLGPSIPGRCTLLGASLPQTYQPGDPILANISSLVCLGCIRSMVSLKWCGFAECLVLFFSKNCLSFLVPLGLGMEPLVPTMMNSQEDIV